jgi:hypothetical protein
VATVWLSWQTAPLFAQIDDVHEQVATPALTPQAWCGPHATALSHWPFAPHVCTPPAEHCVLPGLHGTQAPLTQYGVAPLHALAQPPSDPSTATPTSPVASALTAASAPASPASDSPSSVPSSAPSAAVWPSSPASRVSVDPSWPPSDT